MVGDIQSRQSWLLMSGWADDRAATAYDTGGPGSMIPFGPPHHRFPAQFDPVIANGMAKDPDSRYATTVELADAARDAITIPIPRRRPSSPTLPATEQATLLATEQAPMERFLRLDSSFTDPEKHTMLERIFWALPPVLLAWMLCMGLWLALITLYD
jgi:hypothetical protein